MRRCPAWLCRKSPVRPPRTEPVLSSCHSICNTHPSPKQPLRHRMENTLAQETEQSTASPKTFPLGKGVFPEKCCCRDILHSRQW